MAHCSFVYGAAPRYGALGATARGGRGSLRRSLGDEEGMAMSGSSLARRVRDRLPVRRLSAIGLLALVAIMLSACVEVNQSSTIKTDFTGTTNMRIGVSLLLTNSINGLSTSAPSSGARGTPAPASTSTPAFDEWISEL